MATYYQQPQPAPQPDVNRPIGDILQELPRRYWYTLTHPSPQVFAEQMGMATWRDVWTQVITWGILSAVIGFFVRLITPIPGAIFGQQFMGADVARAYAEAPAAALGDIIGVPLGFFLFMGILFLMARLLGGQGSFLAQSYTSLLFAVPLGLLNTLLGISALFGLVSLAVVVYGLVLQIFAVMAVNQFSGGRATAAVLLPGLLLLAFVIILAAVIVGIILVALGISG